MVIISVVRNFDMYNKFVKDNKFNIGMDFIVFDNRNDNQTITQKYNSFLNSYDYSKEDWFIFCHEDWNILEDWQNKIKYLDKNYLYGPIGCLLNHVLWQDRTIGEIHTSNKDGSDKSITGKSVQGMPEVGTFDCQCLIVHSSLINKHNLRFDENLHFDLYVEDFCITAREKYNIKSFILQLDCHHYSYGVKKERFFNQFKYIQNKHASAQNLYWSTCSKMNIGRKQNFKDLFLKIIKITQRFLYHSYVDEKGTHVIKLCKIFKYRIKDKNSSIHCPPSSS